MNFCLTCLIFTLLLNLEIITCESDENTQIFPDLITGIKVEGNEFQLEAYGWNQNYEILAKNNTKNYGKLKWFSLGYPVLVQMKSNIHSKPDNLFHHSSNGVFTHIQLLTVEHKKMLAALVKTMYNIDIESYQIVNMPLTSFSCEINLKDTETELTVKGEVKSFKNFPLRLDFELPKNSTDIKLFNKSLTRIENDFELKCYIKSKIGYSNKVYINSRKYSPIHNICGLKYSEVSNQSILDESSNLFNFDFELNLMNQTYTLSI